MRGIPGEHVGQTCLKYNRGEAVCPSFPNPPYLDDGRDLYALAKAQGQFLWWWGCRFDNSADFPYVSVTIPGMVIGLTIFRRSCKFDPRRSGMFRNWLRWPEARE